MYPSQRMRRLRRRKIQPIVCENVLRKEDLVVPVFVDEGIERPLPIAPMPGQFRYPLSDIPALAQQLEEEGLGAVLLFGVPATKDSGASGAYAENGVVQEAVRAIRKVTPGMVICTDVCACEYTDHGHCGIVGETPDGPDLLNDPSLSLMERIAVSHAEAGADIVAPSCMLDGMVAAIRGGLDGAGHTHVLVMSYAAKFASAFYGPFREAVDSGYSFGDRTTYQIQPGNGREAFREAQLDAAEGADILLVKPAGLYLDILSRVKTLGLPVAAYQVSGEYAAIKAAVSMGWLREREAAMESLICIRRAGADLIISYFARDAARWMDEE